MSHSPAVNKPAPHIDDVPPKRSRDFADLTHAFFALVLGIGVILFSVYLHGTASGVESDVHSAGRVVSWLMDVPSALLHHRQRAHPAAYFQRVAAKRDFRGFPHIRILCGVGHIRADQQLRQYHADHSTAIQQHIRRHWTAPRFLCRHGIVPHRLRPSAYPLMHQMGLERAVCSGSADGRAFMEFTGWRHRILRHRPCYRHADPFRHRHAEQWRVGITNRAIIAFHRY